MKIVVVDHVTLDGVMQAPGGKEEDTRDRFAHGGWAAPFTDAVIGQTMGELMAQGEALLLGRRTYQHFESFWPKQKDGNPYTEVLNNTRKYVASRTLKGPLPWMNSTLLEGDAAEAAARLKQKPGKNLTVLGSGVLVQSLMQRGLVDELVLTIHPLLLGSGRRLFPDGGAVARLELVGCKPSSTGVIIATYRRGG
jgi:dihydrofolate reductase